MNNLAELLLSYSVESIKLLVTIVVVVSTSLFFLALIIAIVIAGISSMCDLVSRIKIRNMKRKIMKRVLSYGVYRSGKDKW
jgi:hypothetical protein